MIFCAKRPGLEGALEVSKAGMVSDLEELLALDTLEREEPARRMRLGLQVCGLGSWTPLHDLDAVLEGRWPQ